MQVRNPGVSLDSPDPDTLTSVIRWLGFFFFGLTHNIKKCLGQRLNLSVASTYMVKPDP